VTLFSIADNLCVRPDEDITSDVLVFALGLAARLERTARNDRVAAARARMQAAGQPWGRPPRMTAAQVDTARQMADDGQTVRAIAAALGVPRSTVGRAISAMPDAE
jgi:DNA invertase Pin-like site-specific DNA recombinase